MEDLRHGCGKGYKFRVPILDVGTGLPLGGYVLGGTDFLVSAPGLTQPKAGRGIVLPSVLILIHFGEDPTEIYCDHKSAALCFSFIPIYRRCFFLLERRHY